MNIYDHLRLDMLFPTLSVSRLFPTCTVGLSEYSQPKVLYFYCSNVLSKTFL